MSKEILKISDSLSIHDNRIAEIRLFAEIPAAAPDAQSAKVLNAASLLYHETRHGKAQDNVQIPAGAVELGDERYVYRDFRALSQVFLQSRGLDFSRPGVLEKSVDLLKGKTIYANHDFRDIDNWRGVIAEAVWDAGGANAGGVPGINVRTKVDAFLNYRTACGLMMEPPAINAASVTVFSEVEFSHPALVQSGDFWRKFLEEVDGEIVRLIATRIIEFWEMSFVFMGEDRLARALPAESFESQTTRASAQNLNAEKAHGLETTTMKISEEQKQMLGISAEGGDVPEETVLSAAESLAKANKFTPTEIAELSLKATQGERLLAAKRAEVKQVAALAEFGGSEGTLNPVIVKMIDNADADELLTLEADYRSRIEKRLPPGGRSSQENVAGVEAASSAADGKNEEVTTPAIKPTRLL
ncbi:MAG: hypothetical protein KIS76_03875 [Pyrinomonadaceae bacterium]|nr:hypothetical protein [Pyrinomonadaceae bacterium]